jgi:hypothetical protein
MRRAVSFGLWIPAFLSTVACAQAGPAEPKPGDSRLGINLNGPADWNTELPFVDAFHLARAWISQRDGAPWGKGPALDLDERGWVRRLEPGCYAETPLLTISGPHKPPGEYVCLYSGKGRVEFWNIEREVKREPGRIVVELKADGGPFLRIRDTDPADPVRDIHFLLPGAEATWREQPFRSGFLERWRGFNTYRFMDWMTTNGTPQKTWADRPKVDDATWTRRGIPLEVILDLCNAQKVNPWLCLPHQADDDYVRNFAALVKERLDPSLKVWIEYSNEVWNSMFEQQHYAQRRGQELGLGPKERPWEGAAMFYSRRALEIFAIFEQVFGGRERLMRVLAWQAANPWWSENIVLPAGDAGHHADALAIAPYITFLPSPQSKPSAAEIGQWSVDQVLDTVENEKLPECEKWMRDQKAIADKWGLKLVCYESGQHLVGVGGGENVEALTKVFMAANRSPRMGAIYTKYLNAWRDLGGDLMCLFASTGNWSKWGSWGLTEYYDEGEAEQPKLKAVLDWNRAHPRR